MHGIAVASKSHARYIFSVDRGHIVLIDSVLSLSLFISPPPPSLFYSLYLILLHYPSCRLAANSIESHSTNIFNSIRLNQMDRTNWLFLINKLKNFYRKKRPVSFCSTHTLSFFFPMEILFMRSSGHILSIRHRSNQINLCERV